MRHRRILVLLGLLAACAAPAEDAWIPLFDGQTTTGWRGFRSDSAPSGWVVQDSTLMRVGGGGDLMTVDQYADFELELEWRVQACGNSGVMFRVDETAPRTYHSGAEMQILDDACHPDGQNPLTSAGANFGLHPAPRGVVRPAGEWNQARLRVDSAHVQHWLNDSLIVDYQLWSPEWEELVRNSKFVEWPTYGRATRGHIVLQDHGDTVAYRNIRIRILP
ncbi:MAG: DUF1080 domain-containing protein [Gemmatimonadales bacterium]